MRSKAVSSASAVVVLVALVVTACTPRGATPRQPTSAEPMVSLAAASELPVKADGNRYAGDTQAAALRTAVGRLGVDLLRDIRSHGAKADVAVSPFSVYSALALTQGGAKGDTLTEMRRTLHTGAIDPEDADRVYADYLAWVPMAAKLGPDSDKKGTALQLYTANAIWLAPAFAVKQPFLDRGRDWYGAEVALLDMDAASAPGVVNGWVSERTRGKIPRIVDSLDPNTVTVLANAVYLKGSWSDPFEKGLTGPASFHLSDGTDVQLPTMQGHINGRYRETAVYQATEKRMLGGTIYIYLPKPGMTPDDVLSALAAERAKDMAPAWEDRSGDLFLPRFKLAWKDSLTEPLKRLGMPLAFDPDKADFTGLGTVPGQNVWIGDVRHAATTDVDETGIEAAAATVVEMVAGAALAPAKPPVEMRVDRPFVYEVVGGDMPLFIGVVEDPR